MRNINGTKVLLGLLITTVTFVCFSVCDANGNKDGKMNIQGESLVLAKTEPGNLCFKDVAKGSLTLRSTYQPGGTVYEEGRDYLVDYDKGTIARTTDSRIPDYSKNCLYGQDKFDHTKFKNYGNHKWFVWIDYQTSSGSPWAELNDQGQYLKDVRRKLEAGGPFKMVSYGDSITAGGEASKAELRFTNRFASYLQGKFPKSKIELQDVSIPGYCSQQGIDWFDKKLGKVEKPDLVLLGFGMNDHNKSGVAPEKFKNNLVTLVKMIKERTGANVILFSAFPPNDKWIFGSHRMEQYADITRAAAADMKCAYVDVYNTWKTVLKRKDQSSLLGNNINHPNDFGHWLYLQAFEAMKF